jgi:hypothetical protein
MVDMPDPKDYMDDDHVYVRGYVRRKKVSYVPSNRDGGLFLLILILFIIGIWFVATFWKIIVITIGIVIAILAFIFIFKHRSKILPLENEPFENPIQKFKKGILILGAFIALILTISMCFTYFNATNSIENKSTPVIVNKPTLYKTESMITVLPTSRTIPDQQYEIVIDVGIIKQHYFVSWNKLEIDITKSKILSSKISEDEYTALSGRPYTTKIFDIVYIHNILYIFGAILFFVLFVVFYVIFCRNKRKVTIIWP